MGSPIRDSATGGAVGYSRKEKEECYPPVSNVPDDHLPILAPAHLPAVVPQAPEAAGPIPGCSRLDMLYEPHFLRLVRELEVFKAKQLFVPELPKVPEGRVSAQVHVPSSVPQGSVAVLDVRDVGAQGGVTFGSVLVERKAGVGK